MNWNGAKTGGTQTGTGWGIVLALNNLAKILEVCDCRRYLDSIDGGVKGC